MDLRRIRRVAADPGDLRSALRRVPRWLPEPRCRDGAAGRSAMSKKGYQKRLPTVIVPAQRSAPEQESLPSADPDPSRILLLLLRLRLSLRRRRRPILRTADVGRGRARRPGRASSSRALLVVGDADRCSRRTTLPPSTPAGGPEWRRGPPIDRGVLRGGRGSADGTISVRQLIRSTDRVRRVSLALPDAPDGMALAAEDVRVLADGSLRFGPAGIDGRRTTYRFAARHDGPAELRPRRRGDRQRRGDGAGARPGDRAGRALPHRPAAETRVVRAPAVLALACTPSVERVPEPCGAPDGDNWRVELKGRSDDDG